MGLLTPRNSGPYWRLSRHEGQRAASSCRIRHERDSRFAALQQMLD